ncbi:telomere binding protein, partial [Ascosphaera acerosa]
MDGLLTAIKTSRATNGPASPAPSAPSDELRPAATRQLSAGRAASVAACIEILKDQPSHAELLGVLQFLDPASVASDSTSQLKTRGSPTPDGGGQGPDQVQAGSAPSSNDQSPRLPFDIRLPGAQASQILHLLTSVVVPTFWPTLRREKPQPQPRQGSPRLNARAALLRCFSSVAGVASLVARLQVLLAASSPPRHQPAGAAPPAAAARARPEADVQVQVQVQVQDVLSVLANVLKPPDFVLRVYAHIHNHGALSPTQRRVLWQEFVAYVAGSKVLSACGRAVRAADLSASSSPPSSSWLAGGREYAAWLGRAIAVLALAVPTSSTKGNGEGQDPYAPVALLLSRAMKLGYNGCLFNGLGDGLLGHDGGVDAFRRVLTQLKKHEQLACLTSTIQHLESHCFSAPASISAPDDAHLRRRICGVAHLLARLTTGNTHLAHGLRDWLAEGKVSQAPPMQRSLVAALLAFELEALLRKALAVFGDPLAMKHAPLAQQEAVARAVLLCAARLRRENDAALRHIARSAVYLQAVTNRLAASSPRARTLGMLVAMALSEMVEKPGDALRFELDAEQAEALAALRRLATTVDEPVEVPYAQLRPGQVLGTASRLAPGSRTAAPTAAVFTERAIEDLTLSSGGDSGDEDGNDDAQEFLPYEKPDSDPEDSDEDAANIVRDKPRPPIYIRDLLEYLRDSENCPRYHLGITSAATLIRRKASFGTEVPEHMTELAAAAVALQDKYNLAGFHEHRLRAQVALLVCYPRSMAGWFVRMLFGGDISQDQRSTILAALGLSARELAGYAADASVSAPALAAQFPSKRLPAAMEAIYADGASTMQALAQAVSDTALQPLAEEAVEASTGPRALKTRVFSSRMEVEARRRRQEEQRKRRIAPDVHRLLAESFYLPLISSFNVVCQA